jgi:hypothetical protein
MDWDWRIAVGLRTVELGFSGYRRNPLEDLPDESHPVKHPGNQPAKECSSVVGKYTAIRNESRARGHTNSSLREVPSQSDGFSLFFGV